MTMVIRKDRCWPSTPNIGLPLYRPRDNADLTAQYNSAMNKLDTILSGMSGSTSGSGSPTAPGKPGDLYVDEDTLVMYVAVEQNGKTAWKAVKNENDCIVRPSMWFSGKGSPRSSKNYQKQDFWLDSDTGRVYVFVGEASASLNVRKDDDGLSVLYDGDVRIAKNWFPKQGLVSYDYTGKTDYPGIPNGVTPVELPINVYVTPFSFDSNFAIADYDIYYRLSGPSFDSGRHFEHHLAGDAHVDSIAEVPIAKKSEYDSCIFTVATTISSRIATADKTISFETFGLYAASEYEAMQLAGVSWFDQDSNIAKSDPWLYVMTIGGEAAANRGSSLHVSQNTIVPNSTVDYQFFTGFEDVRKGDIVIDKNGSMFEIVDINTELKTVLVGQKVADLTPDAYKTIDDASVNADGHLVITMTDGTEIDAGNVKSGILRFGTGEPPAVGIPGDTWIDVSTGDCYQYENVQ